VSGMTYERANAELADQDLLALRVDEPNADVAVGNVIRTDPDAGASVSPQQQVRVYVSQGQQMATMPVVVGLGQDAATSALTSAGLVLGTITPRNDPELATGTVISADQTDGAQVADGTPVNLVVASGRVTIDDVTGYTIDAATRELESLGLTVTTQEDTTCKAAAPPTVASQSLAPGDVPIHSPITLNFCSGQ
jgi:beta-lactam-binding protein with PASTA domain